MPDFNAEFKKLNPRQKEAVEAIDGPVLVIAGPGTGKTQLLSMRVANILRKTDVDPGNILCLTFTDNAARNMRERLSTIVGQAAYHVSIHTFHSFGVEIINQYPDFFTKRQLLQQVDELGQYELLKEIFEELPHSNPLSTKVGDQFVHLKSSLRVIGWLKQNALAPAELHIVLRANNQFMDTINKELADIFAAMPSPKHLDRYTSLLKAIESKASGKQYFGFPEYGTECADELRQAVEETDASGRYAPKITAWRNAWCRKDAEGRHVFKDSGQASRKMHALANVYQELLDKMSEQGLYDFDDMVGEAVHGLENIDELRYNLQERYQYVLVDEFQDTNKAQLRMLASLGNNPLYENRPNIMAVGDDDQAIYAFQGAQTSNMAAFLQMYDQPLRITLEENYRSNANILDTASSIAGQITDRLNSLIPDTDKTLVAKKTYEINELQHLSFPSELAQYDAVAERISQLIKDGAKPEEIAVIAPRHKYLERLMPYLGSRHVPVAYERRENILEAAIIVQLLTMSELAVALTDNRQEDVDAIASQVLAYDFWGISNDDLIELSLEAYSKHTNWLKLLIKHKNPRLRAITGWFVELSRKSSLEPMEYILDQLIGAKSVGIDSEHDELARPAKSKPAFVSPMREHYFSEERYEESTDSFLTLLGQLSTLRQRLRQWKPNRTLYIKDFVEFSELHQQAGIKIVDTNPHTQTTNAVQVMTAYKAKGLEFDTVFVINAQDEVWGPTAKSQSSRISLPKNLPIEPPSTSDNDKLRLLFVALTRAKSRLLITSYTHTLENKLSPVLSFFENAGDGEECASPALKPKPINRPATAEEEEILSTDWAYRFRQVIADKPTLFEPILANYKLSVTHLNNFIDIVNSGPNYFFLHNLLRFPEALTPAAAYGDSIHKTLQWTHSQLREQGKLPSQAKTADYFADMLSRKHLRKSDHKKLIRRGQEALQLFLAERADSLLASDLIERGFNNEGAVVSEANLSGKIDKIRFTDKGRAVVFDFKTGKPSRSWQGRDEFEKIKLHKYKQQLMFYKLLVENSASYSGKVSVESGALEFVEKDEAGKLLDNLELSFTPQEQADFARLIGAVWRHINELSFPETSGYKQNLSGILQFEKDLLEGNI